MECPHGERSGKQNYPRGREATYIGGGSYYAHLHGGVMTQQQPPPTGQVQITADDFNSLMQVDELTRVKVHNIALQRRVAELEEEVAKLEAQIAEPDTTTTNNKNDSKLTAVGAD